MNILFVCEYNLNRSPFFKDWFKKNRPQYNVRSCGTSYGYLDKLSKELLEWADKVYVMDIEQEMSIKRRFPDFMNKIEIIGVSDGTPNLYKIIEYWVEKKEL